MRIYDWGLFPALRVGSNVRTIRSTWHGRKSGWSPRYQWNGPYHQPKVIKIFLQLTKTFTYGNSVAQRFLTIGTLMRRLDELVAQMQRKYVIGADLL